MNQFAYSQCLVKCICAVFKCKIVFENAFENLPASNTLYAIYSKYKMQQSICISEIKHMLIDVLSVPKYGSLMPEF